MRTVIALGGNALRREDMTQQAAVEQTATALEDIISEDEVVLTHGNGPQVGERMLQQPDDDPLPLDVLVAETQGQIGYQLQQAINNAAPDHRAVTLLTQVLIDTNDAAFDDPTKPVGPFYTAQDADKHEFVTRKVRDETPAYRRVVPSPQPRGIVELAEIQDLLGDDRVVICCGGGGIPVTATDGGLSGVEAVIDKDRASALLGADLDAETLVIVTDVPYAYYDYGGDNERPIEDIDADTLETWLKDDMFGVGSMRPKVTACISFLRDGGQRAIITDIAHLDAALVGEAGTQVIP